MQTTRRHFCFGEEIPRLLFTQRRRSRDLDDGCWSMIMNMMMIIISAYQDPTRFHDQDAHHRLQPSVGNTPGWAPPTRGSTTPPPAGLAADADAWRLDNKIRI